jgi:hypothetical protein
MRTLEEAQSEGRFVIAAIEARGGDAADFLLPLSAEQYQLVGIVVQWTAYALLAAQQLIDFVEEQQGSPIRPANASLRDNEVIPLLMRYVRELPISFDDRDALVVGLTMIQTMMDIRHHVAHMALRKHPEVDALIGLSLRRRENFRRAGIEPKYGHAMVAYIPLPELRSNLAPLEKNVNFAANLYARVAKS